MDGAIEYGRRVLREAGTVALQVLGAYVAIKQPFVRLPFQELWVIGALCYWNRVAR